MNSLVVDLIILKESLYSLRQILEEDTNNLEFITYYFSPIKKIHKFKREFFLKFTSIFSFKIALGVTTLENTIHFSSNWRFRG